jgi:hypothetical protein
VLSGADLPEVLALCRGVPGQLVRPSNDRHRAVRGGSPRTPPARRRGSADHVTLNVKADNQAALALYADLGFTPIAEYEECGLTVR